MKIEISSFGVGSRYTVDFDRTDTASLETFLASKDVYPSDRQIKRFATEGECVEFTRMRGRNAVKSVVRDITESERRQEWVLKARGIVNRWNHEENVVRMCNMLTKFDVGLDIKRTNKIIRLQNKWDAKVKNLLDRMDAIVK